MRAIFAVKTRAQRAARTRAHGLWNEWQDYLCDRARMVHLVAGTHAVAELPATRSMLGALSWSLRHIVEDVIPAIGTAGYNGH
jgi:hypothetical protein